MNEKKYIIKWTLLWEELHHQRQLFNFTSVHLSTKHVNQLTFLVPQIHFASLVRQDQWEMTKPWFGRGLLYSACWVNGICMCTSSKECLWHILIWSDPQDTLNKLTFLRHIETEHCSQRFHINRLYNDTLANRVPNMHQVIFNNKICLRRKSKMKTSVLRSRNFLVSRELWRGDYSKSICFHLKHRQLGV